jgi:nitroimidazol reductase NimA-like FMN-containing flavoprotein (pyridoxamine 5'-phosphate oxidase superfamily)
MTTIQPVATQNIDGYDAPTIPWEKALGRLEDTFRLQGPGEEGTAHTRWLATTRPDGRPHVVPLGAIWLDGAMYFSAGENTRKARNLATNPHCVVTFSAPDLDIVVEGEAENVTEEAKLRRVADVYESIGWAPTVRDGAFYHEYSAPSAGPPPWHVYEVTPTTIFGLGTDEPYGATRWRFDQT